MLLISAVGLTGILLLTFSEIYPDKKDEAFEQTDCVSDVREYEESLEKRLKELLSQIKGAGKISVMVTLDSGNENIYAKEEKHGEKNTESRYVIVDDAGDEVGLLLRVTEPEVRGVAVVCEGAASAQVRQEIINTVSAVLNISTNRISIAQIRSDNGG